MHNETGEEHQIARVAERLTRRFPHATRADVDAVVAAALRQFEGRPIREFIPLLVERRADSMLRSGPDSAPERLP